MTSQSFTEQEKSDLIQALNASIHRLRSKIKNDSLHGRDEYDRVKCRIDKIERAKVLISKFTENGEEERRINGIGEGRF